jgi:hypothetical protein
MYFNIAEKTLDIQPKKKPTKCGLKTKNSNY